MNSNPYLHYYFCFYGGEILKSNSFRVKSAIGPELTGGKQKKEAIPHRIAPIPQIRDLRFTNNTGFRLRLYLHGSTPCG
jgi:hypothetical protein